MKKSREEFKDSGLPFPEEIKTHENEHGSIATIISDQFLYSFKKYIRQMGLTLDSESLETQDPAGKAYDTYSLTIKEKSEKKELICFIREFLDAMGLDWFEDTNEDSGRPDFTFCLPLQSMLTSR